MFINESARGLLKHPTGTTIATIPFPEFQKSSLFLLTRQWHFEISLPFPQMGETKNQNISKLVNLEIPFTNTLVQDLGFFLNVHFEELDKFFQLMDRSQGNGNCQTCEFSSMGRFILQRFKAEAECVRESIEKELGRIRIARENREGKILGIVVVQPKTEAA